MVVQETQWCRDGEVLLPECPDQSSNPAPYCCLPAQTIPEPVTVDDPTREDGDAGANCVCRGGSKRCKTKELGKTSRAFADQWAQWKPMEARQCWGSSQKPTKQQLSFSLPARICQTPSAALPAHLSSSCLQGVTTSH